MLQKTPLGGSSGGDDKPPIWVGLVTMIMLIMCLAGIAWLLLAPGENAP